VDRERVVAEDVAVVAVPVLRARAALGRGASDAPRQPPFNADLNDF